MSRRTLTMVLAPLSTGPGDVSKDYPKLPDFCDPYQSGSTFGWIEGVVSGITNLSRKEKARYERKIDIEVRAAIFLFQEIDCNSELHDAWCRSELWTDRKKKPTPNDKTNLLEEVFRLIWAICQEDADGYELRLTAVRAMLDEGIDIGDVTQRIREAGGYVAVRSRVRLERKSINTTIGTDLTSSDAKVPAASARNEPSADGGPSCKRAKRRQPSGDSFPRLKQLEGDDTLELSVNKRLRTKLLKLDRIPGQFAQVLVRVHERRDDGWLSLTIVKVKIRNG